MGVMMLHWNQCDCWRVAVQEDGHATKNRPIVGSLTRVKSYCDMMNKNVLTGVNCRYVAVMSKYDPDMDIIL